MPKLIATFFEKPKFVVKNYYQTGQKLMENAKIETFK